MKSDVLAWSEGRPGDKIVSKETLNHHGIVELVSGLDVYTNTPGAFLAAYRALGIDIVNRVPLGNAPRPTAPGTVRAVPGKPYIAAPLGIFDTVMRFVYPCTTPEDVWSLDISSLNYSGLMTPVPHSCDPEDIRKRESALGETGLYYPMLYTTLFMWGVEVLGWEIFMLAAFDEPERFHRHFILPCVEKSKTVVEGMTRNSENPFLFVHDDLASAAGPMFPPSWYDDYIFPHYPEIWAAAKLRGKKVIFVADGDMSEFLPKLAESGVDGIQFENPATPLESVIEHFGGRGKFMIGGIDTLKLTTGTPREVRDMVYDLAGRMRDVPGFAISSCGGLHGNIPNENITAYFDARSDIGATPKDWRHIGRQSV